MLKQLQKEKRLNRYVTDLIIEINDRYKFIPEVHDCYESVISYVHMKTMEGVLKFKATDDKFKAYTSIIIRCRFQEAKKNITKDVNIQRGKCENCILTSLYR